MHITILTMKFSLPGCRSLKEKRQRIGGMHERYGRQPAVAVCESADRDRLDASEWTFVVTGITAQEVQSLCSEIEDRIQRTVEARVLEVIHERLQAPGTGHPFFQSIRRRVIFITSAEVFTAS